MKINKVWKKIFDIFEVGDRVIVIKGPYERSRGKIIRECAGKHCPKKEKHWQLFLDSGKKSACYFTKEELSHEF